MDAGTSLLETPDCETLPIEFRLATAFTYFESFLKNVINRKVFLCNMMLGLILHLWLLFSSSFSKIYYIKKNVLCCYSIPLLFVFYCI